MMITPEEYILKIELLKEYNKYLEEILKLRWLIV